MKKNIYFILLVLISIIFIGCDKDKEILIDPQLIVSEDTLFFNDDEYKVLSISTKPVSESEYKITSYPSWVTVSHTSGNIINNIENIGIHSMLKDSLPGVYTGEIEIISTSGTQHVTLRGYAGEQMLYSLPKDINFSVFEAEKNILLSNDGNVLLEYEASLSNEFVTLSSNKGKVGVGKHESLSLKINNEIMESGTYETQIYFKINNISDTVSVVVEHFKERKLILKDEVVDSEYSRISDKLVYVSSNPLSLVIYNVADKSFDRIPLSYSPRCISVSLDGKEAVVGHDAKITYVDLIKKSIIKTIEVPYNIFDIALGNNKWAYAVPSGGYYTPLLSIDLVNERIERSSYSYSGMDIRLHPSGKYAYFGSQNSSLDNIKKINIENGAATDFDSFYFNENYPSGSTIWFSEDGKRAFTSSRTVFKCSPSQGTDLIYNGTISTDKNPDLESSKIQWLDDSSKKKNLYIIYNGNYYNNNKKLPNVYVYNSDNLLLKRMFELEKYLVVDNLGGGRLYNAEPHFVFANSSGKSVYVLAKADGSGLLHEWSLQEFNVE